MPLKPSLALYSIDMPFNDFLSDKNRLTNASPIFLHSRWVSQVLDRDFVLYFSDLRSWKRNAKRQIVRTWAQLNTCSFNKLLNGLS